MRLGHHRSVPLLLLGGSASLLTSGGGFSIPPPYKFPRRPTLLCPPISPSVSSCRQIVTKMASDKDQSALSKLGVNDPKKVTDKQWEETLSPEEFDVTRKSGTEAPFTNKYDKFFERGRYVCRCCGCILFSSDSKYWSGCGWPAFSKSVDSDLNIIRITDNSHGMERVEVRCKQCDAHLGHVFDDGPAETGERYCINSVSMIFEPQT